MKRRTQAMSLIETIYATLLLGFIALFLLNLYPSSFVAIKRGESTFTADNFASTILEDVRSRSFANIVVAQPADLVYQNQTWGGITYSPVVTINMVPWNNTGGMIYSPDPNHIRSVSVTVNWVYSAMNHQVVHEEYVHNVTR